MRRPRSRGTLVVGQAERSSSSVCRVTKKHSATELTKQSPIVPIDPSKPGLGSRPSRRLQSAPNPQDDPQRPDTTVVDQTVCPGHRSGVTVWRVAPRPEVSSGSTTTCAHAPRLRHSPGGAGQNPVAWPTCGPLHSFPEPIPNLRCSLGQSDGLPLTSWTVEGLMGCSRDRVVGQPLQDLTAPAHRAEPRRARQCPGRDEP